MLALLSLLGGGLMRCLPEILAIFDKKADNDHEFRMLNAQIELEKLKSADKQAEILTQGTIDEAVAGLNAQMEALKGQMQVTGIKVVDVLNFLVRPITTYMFLSMFAVYKAALLAVALSMGANGWNAILQVYGPDDANMLMGILSFWFVGRVFDKKQ
jgi:hypothetical protein